MTSRHGPPHSRRPGPPRARKRFGQHFLADAEALAHIADLVRPAPGDLVLEVGPGRGALTGPLLDRLEHLVAIEIDRDLIAYLRERFSPPTLQLIEGDILDLDIQRLLSEAARQTLFVVGNLPYNITAPVLFRLRDHAHLVSRAVLTLQKEVAQRLVASAGTRQYSQLTVLLTQCARMQIRRQIPSTSFRPQPKVDSAVVDVHFEPCRVDVGELRRFEQIVRSAFGQRRKMLRNALLALPSPDGDGSIDRETLSRLAAEAGIDLTRRAEELTVQEFARLSHEFIALCS